MRYLVLIFGLLLLVDLSAQNSALKYDTVSIDTNQLLRQYTKELILAVLSDSSNKNIQYVYNHYDLGGVRFIDDIISNKRHKNRKMNKSNDSIPYLIYNQFIDYDHSFTVRHLIDTSNLIPNISCVGKIFTGEKSLNSKIVLFIARPIFSHDLSQVYIRTSQSIDGGSAGYEYYYKLINSEWIKVKYHCIWRQ